MPVREIADQPEHPYPTFVRKLLKDQDIPYVDGFELSKKHGMRGGMFLPYNDHLNADGYRIIAQEMSPLIRGLINSYQHSFSDSR
jgi:lysophospholipase L1-like esterase